LSCTPRKGSHSALVYWVPMLSVLCLSGTTRDATQVVKVVVPLYLGACHQCQRLPVQRLRAAAAQLAAAGAATIAAAPLEE
jgi:hypothetical protein